MRVVQRTFFLFMIVTAVVTAVLVVEKKPAREFHTGGKKEVAVVIDGVTYRYADIVTTRVGEALREVHVDVSDRDRIFPEKGQFIASGSVITIERMKQVSILVDGGQQSLETYGRDVASVIDEAKVTLKDEDIVVPDRTTRLMKTTKIKITRVEIREESVDKPIAYQTKETEDDELSWRKRVVTQKGVNGVKTFHYKVSYHDGKEVARKLLRSEVTKDPVTEIVTQGTFVKVGKSHRGAASWYAWTGTMAAANPWLPKGSYVRVTNLENGKSVIVVINDRGPFVPGRIIDLDKVAFQKIAAIGAGVINVKMEEIVN